MTGNCEVCGNEYDKAFEVVAAGAHHLFDCFECAIEALAPHCEHCGCHVIGHGVASCLGCAVDEFWRRLIGGESGVAALEDDAFASSQTGAVVQGYDHVSTSTGRKCAS